MTATARPHRAIQSRGRLAVGLLALIGLTLMAASNLDGGHVRTTQPEATIPSTDRVTSPVPTQGPVVIEVAREGQELGRVTSAIPAHATSATRPPDREPGMHRGQFPDGQCNMSFLQPDATRREVRPPGLTCSSSPVSTAMRTRRPPSG